MKHQKIASLAVAAVLLSVLLAYFGRPKPPLLELVTARQEMPGLAEHLPGSTALADRVTQSVALILVRNPYAANNAVALESLRTWAAERFQRQPGFLHPIALETQPGTGQTLFDSLFYNLGAYAYYGLEEFVGNCLQSQIARFHETKAYNTFRTSYFDLFGTDADSATLLARYQTDRAKSAVDVIIWAVVWTISASAGLTYVLSGQPGTRFNRLRKTLSWQWLLLSGCYMVLAFSQNQVGTMVSSLVAAAFGLFLRKPTTISRQEGGVLKVLLINIPSRWLAITLWVTLSLAAIQILTWIRVGTLSDPDPITLLLSSLTGNFLYDPAHGKVFIMRTAGLLWLAASAWAIAQSRRDAATAREAEKALAAL
jgi:hypothetical protein